MQTLNRNVAMTFRVSEQEREMIQRRQAQTNIRSLRAYLLKQAVDGRVINLELASKPMCQAAAQCKQ